MRLSRPLAAALLLGLVAGGGMAVHQPAPTPEGQDATLSGETLWGHLQVLASDDMEGRGTGSDGQEKAAEYIAGILRSLGLSPLGDGDSFLQHVPMHGSWALPDSDLAIFSPCASRHLELGADYLPFTTGSATFIARPAEMVFAGFGIVAPEFDYNDYLGLNVADKVVVALAGEPQSSDPAFFAGELETVYATPETKQRIALSRGARGLVLVPSAAAPQWLDWGWARQQFAFEHVTLAYAVPRMLAVLMSPASAEVLFCDAPRSLVEVDTMAASHTLRSFPLVARLWFRGSFSQRDFLASNVIGLLPGRDPELRESYVIVSAHYDHLGLGPAVDGDRIYNGAVDNAIGVAAVLEIARVLAQGPRPRRSVIFLLTTGEEKGLLGSSYYVDHPAVPLHRTVAAVNVDGLATFDTFRDIVSVGGGLSTLGKTLKVVARRHSLTLASAPSQAGLLVPYLLSDQHAFAQAGVPAILVNEGFSVDHHSPAEALERALGWLRERYHTPSDDLSQPLNKAAALQHAGVILALVEELATSDKVPHWHPGSPYANARLLSQIEQR